MCATKCFELQWAFFKRIMFRIGKFVQLFLKFSSAPVVVAITYT